MTVQAPAMISLFLSMIFGTFWHSSSSVIIVLATSIGIGLIGRRVKIFLTKFYRNEKRYFLDHNDLEKRGDLRGCLSQETVTLL